MFLNIKQIRNELDDLFSFLRLNMQSFPFCLQQTKHFLTQKFPKEKSICKAKEKVKWWGEGRGVNFFWKLC